MADNAVSKVVSSLVGEKKVRVDGERNDNFRVTVLASD